jgi:hypothetical protein
MAYKLMCPGDTYPPMKSFVIEDGKGMNLPDQLYNLIKEVENQLKK